MQFRDVLARKRPSRDALRTNEAKRDETADAENTAPGKSLDEALAEALGTTVDGARKAVEDTAEGNAPIAADTEEGETFDQFDFDQDDPDTAEDDLGYEQDDDEDEDAYEDEDAQDLAADAVEAQEFATPDPTVLRPTPARKQIWELEPDADEAPEDTDEAAFVPRPAARLRRDEDAPRAPQSKPVMLRRPVSVPLQQTPGPAQSQPQPQSPSAGRVKTRILGFHSGGIEADVFDTAEPARQAADMYPAGWIVVVAGPGRGASFSVVSGVSTIGRGADQTISLDFGDASVSRQNHASVAYDSEQSRFFIGHGGKSNIVRRNGNPVLATEELCDGDEIRIGKTTLKFVALCGPDFSWDDEDAQEDDAGRH